MHQLTGWIRRFLSRKPRMGAIVCYSHQNTSPSTTKANSAGNTDSGNHNSAHRSCLTFATTASANAVSDASNPPISDTAPRTMSNSCAGR